MTVKARVERLETGLTTRQAGGELAAALISTRGQAQPTPAQLDALRQCRHPLARSMLASYRRVGWI